LCPEAIAAAKEEQQVELASHPAASSAVHLVAGDFFSHGSNAESKGPFDVGYDYTFLCALHPGELVEVLFSVHPGEGGGEGAVVRMCCSYMHRYSSVLFSVPYFTMLLLHDCALCCADMRQDWAKAWAEIIAPAGELVTLIFPIGANPPGAPQNPPWPVTPELYQELLLPAGEGWS
jgi:hypothetical protein